MLKGSLLGIGLFVFILAGAFFYNTRSAAQPQQVSADLSQAFAQGETIYAANCASCHAEDGAGYASVQNAPALNGSEHSWHHPDEQIIGLIRQGGNGMPAVGANWSDEEMAAVLTYVKAWWTPQQQRAQQGDIGE